MALTNALTIDQIRAGIAKAKAEGNASAVRGGEALLAARQSQAAGVGKIDRQHVADAFYRAQATGNEPAMRGAMQYLRAHGMTLAPPSRDQLAEIEKGSLKNVAGGVLDRYALGVGKGFSDTAAGALQAVGVNPERVGLFVDNGAADEALGTAGTLGGVTAQGLMLAAPGGAVGEGLRGLGIAAKTAPYVAAALENAALAAAQPAKDQTQRAQNAAVGGVLGVGGMAAGEALAGLTSHFSGAIDRGISIAKREALNNAKKYGIPLRVRDVSDSRFIHSLASGIDQFPLSGASAKLRNIFRSFTKAAAADAGIDASELSPAILSKRWDQIDAAYNSLFNRTTVHFTPEDLVAVSNIAKRARELPTSPASPSINGLVARLHDLIVTHPNGIPGRDLQDFRLSDIRRVINSTDPVAKDDAREIENVVMDAAKANMGTKDSAEFSLLQNQTRSLHILQNAISKRASGASGFVSPQALWALTHTKFGASQRMLDLASIGQNLLKADPSSGTAERIMGVYPFLRAVTGGMGGLAIERLAPELVKPYLAIAAAGATLGRAFNSNTLAHAVGGLESADALSALARASANAGSAVAPKAIPIAGLHTIEKHEPLVVPISAPQKGPNTFSVPPTPATTAQPN